ncbi:uncharacterized protein LOC124789350 [Schistocerca piceifrons]|uniref:uncharacterized protein LOC124789350 n=1 Tax=Schistocerca piceifrons TaxID=274613 RepID=UPI001F5E6C4E|nr:uncharacterized protein LOC124789350 [Schistocerca piceifrons]
MTEHPGPMKNTDYIPQVLVGLDQQLLEMEKAQAQLDYDDGSTHMEGCTEEGMQGGGQMAAAPEKHQIMELLEEEEEFDLPEWVGDLVECGNELLKAWNRSGEDE